MIQRDKEYGKIVVLECQPLPGQRLQSDPGTAQDFLRPIPKIGQHIFLDPETFMKGIYLQQKIKIGHGYQLSVSILKVNMNQGGIRESYEGRLGAADEIGQYQKGLEDGKMKEQG
jgi:hypothetical protein